MAIIDQKGGAKVPGPGFFSRKVRAAQRYYLDLAPPESKRLAVVCGGFEECAPDYAIRRTNFPYYVFEWVVRGRGRVRLDGRWSDIRAGSFFSYPPGMPHQIETDRHRPLAKHFVSFTGSGAADTLRSAGVRIGVVLPLPVTRDTVWVFEALLHDGSGDIRIGGVLCVTLLRYLCQKISRAGSATPRGDHVAYATYQRCDQLMVENTTRLGSLAEFAELCGLSEAYLCRLYRRFGQLTPYQRLLRLKMTEAANRLAETRASVGDIARLLGFEDLFSFSRTFKSVLGISPSHFRQLHCAK